jgi:hypothetical protein
MAAPAWRENAAAVPLPAWRGGQTQVGKLVDFLSRQSNPQNEIDTTPSTGIGAGSPIQLAPVPQRPATTPVSGQTLAQQAMNVGRKVGGGLRDSMSKVGDGMIDAASGLNPTNVNPTIQANVPIKRNKPVFNTEEFLKSLDIPWMFRKPTGLNQYDTYRWFNNGKKKSPTAVMGNRG